jgi:soluble lytic murein transglycosylase-like protein
MWLLLTVCFLFGDVLGTLTPAASRYSTLVEKWSARRGLDKLLVAAVIHKETGGSWNPRAKSRTNDHGLMQLHVGRHTRSKFIGKEHLLYNPNRNIKLGTRAMRFWKRHHKLKCQGNNHHWLLHYNQGRRVSTKGWVGGYAKRVLIIYRKLKAIEDRFVVMK